MEKYKVRAKIIRVIGNKPCDFGHKVGQEFEFTLTKNPDMCIYALNALMPAVNTLLHGGSFEWTDNSEVTEWGCPHPGEGQVIFRLERKKLTSKGE